MEAWVDLGDERPGQIFAMRAMASGAAFHRASLHANTAGVSWRPTTRLRLFRRRLPPVALRHLASAVRKILRAIGREETVRFMRSARMAFCRRILHAW